MAVRFVTRAQWGARPPKTPRTRPLSLIRGFAWHHSGSFLSPSATTLQEIEVVRFIQNWCMDHHGYSDIDYCSLIGPSGAIYEGRGAEVVEAAQLGIWPDGSGEQANSTLLGVCFLGDFTRPGEVLTPEAQSAAETLSYVAQISLKPHGAFAAGVDNFTHAKLADHGGTPTGCLARPACAQVDDFLVRAFHTTT